MRTTQTGGPARWTSMPAPSSCRSTTLSCGRFTPARSAAALPTVMRSCGDSALRHLPESADTGPARSDGRGIDLLDHRKGL